MLLGSRCTTTVVFVDELAGIYHHQVFLGNSGEVKNYSSLPIQPGSAINRDLQLDYSQRHLYIMTSNTVSHLTQLVHWKRCVIIFYYYY